MSHKLVFMTYTQWLYGAIIDQMLFCADISTHNFFIYNENIKILRSLSNYYKFLYS